MVPDRGCLYVEGGVHFCTGVYFQLHNIGLGFCADCPAEGDILGCAMMLAPCSDSRQQQVGGQSSQGTGQGKPGSGLSWDAPHFPLGHLLLVGPHPFMDHSPIVMTQLQAQTWTTVRQYQHLSLRELEKLFSQCFYLTDEETEGKEWPTQGQQTQMSLVFRHIKGMSTVS